MNFKLDGKAITGGLRAFNEWRDDFLIEASTGFLMLGFVAGTVDVFTKGGLSANYDFTIAWATVQAIAIDGLFFAVWGKVARATWTRATWFKNAMLILVGLLLAVVATLVNGILSYQELMGIADVKVAMTQLGVDQAVFTYARSVLVVLVAILVALFCRSRQAIEEDSPALSVVVAQDSPVEVAQATQITEAGPTIATAINKSPAIPEQEESVAHIPDTDGDIIAIHEAMVDTEDSPSPSHRDRIKAVIIEHNDGLSYADIACIAGVGYSTVKKHVKNIREELKGKRYDH